MFPHSSPLKSTRSKTSVGAITASALGHEINLSHVLAEVCYELYFFQPVPCTRSPRPPHGSFLVGVLAPSLSRT